MNTGSTLRPQIKQEASKMSFSSRGFMNNLIRELKSHALKAWKPMTRTFIHSTLYGVRQFYWPLPSWDEPASSDLRIPYPMLYLHQCSVLIMGKMPVHSYTQQTCMVVYTVNKVAYRKHHFATSVVYGKYPKPETDVAVTTFNCFTKQGNGCSQIFPISLLIKLTSFFCLPKLQSAMPSCHFPPLCSRLQSCALVLWAVFGTWTLTSGNCVSEKCSSQGWWPGGGEGGGKGGEGGGKGGRRGRRGRREGRASERE